MFPDPAVHYLTCLYISFLRDSDYMAVHNIGHHWFDLCLHIRSNCRNKLFLVQKSGNILIADYLLVYEIYDSVRRQLLVILLIQEYIHKLPLGNLMELRHYIRILVKVFSKLRL